MSLLTKPSALTAASRIIYTLVNTLYDDIYEKLGNTVSGRGTLTYINLATNADLAATQIADTAAVLGGSTEQTFTRPTSVGTNAPYYETARGGWGPDLRAANAQAVAITGVTTFALTASKAAYTVTSVGAATLDTITGGSDNDVIYLILPDSAVTVSSTAADTANSIRLLNAAASVAGIAGGCVIRLQRLTLVANSRWHQI